MSIYTYDEFQKALKEGATCTTDDKLLHTFCSKDFLLYFKRRNNEGKTYRYLITFTLKNDTFEEDEVEKYIIKQLKRKPLQIIGAHINKEYTKKGRAHWHASIESIKSLKKDRFHYYIKKYGNIDISKTKAQNLEEGINYISKDSISKKII